MKFLSSAAFGTTGLRRKVGVHAITVSLVYTPFSCMGSMLGSNIQKSRNEWPKNKKHCYPHLTSLLLFRSTSLLLLLPTSLPALFIGARLGIPGERQIRVIVVQVIKHRVARMLASFFRPGHRHVSQYPFPRCFTSCGKRAKRRAVRIHGEVGWGGVRGKSVCSHLR